MISDHPASNADLLPMSAAYLMKNGIDRYSALKTITCNSAVNLGIDKYCGSISKGKSADLIIHSGKPLDFMNRIEKVYIKGRNI